MYDGCFGLKRRPFGAAPQIDDYFPATAIEGARTTLVRCIQRGEGAGLVVGPSGTGKTLLCLMLAEQFRRSFQVAMLASGRLSTRRALFQAILYELGQPYRGMDEGEARLAVIDHLMNGDSGSRGMVLLVDEAHTLPLRLLEEIRLLTNLVRNGQPLVRLVLLGGAILEERFASPKLDSFSQRLTARCYLESLNRTETQEYIQAQINTAGGQGDMVFPDDTCQSVFQATGGVPRLINQVCDHALLLAYVAGRNQIEPVHIEEAWGDLQQLPTPWTGESKEEHGGGGVIEFGSLDEEGEGALGDVAGTSGAPTFRVTSLEDELEPSEGEPGQQIHRIERLLAEADDEFQPAGSIGPEIELRFDEAAHPFQEQFEHEEVVADRYATSVAGLTPVPMRQGVATEPEPEVELEQELAKHAEAAFSAGFEPEFSSTLPEWEPVSVSVSTAPIELVPMELVAAVAEPEPVAPTPGPVAEPRRREYRQLFARLRRG